MDSTSAAPRLIEQHAPGFPAVLQTHELLQGDNAEILPVLAAHLPPVDVVYLDPPYNTGNSGWLYDDARTEDEWLTFMRERLLLVRGMLADDGAVAVSIGAGGVHHLAALMAETFRNHRTHLITVEVSGGKSARGIRQVAEYLILALPDGFRPAALPWAAGERRQPWEGLTLSTAPKGRYPNQVYPVVVDNHTRRIIHVGPSLQDLLDAGDTFDPTQYPFTGSHAFGPDASVLWPVSSRGGECSWRLARSAFVSAVARGHVKADPTRTPGNPNAFSLKYLPAGAVARVETGEIETLGREVSGALILQSAAPVNSDIPTMWARKEHHTSKGTARLRELIGPNSFPYPKSVALVRDVLTALTGGRPDAVVLDLFAGSGTTLEAVCELNAADGGRRRAVLVTLDEGGLFDSVTVPRVEAVSALHGAPVMVTR